MHVSARSSRLFDPPFGRVSSKRSAGRVSFGGYILTARSLPRGEMNRERQPSSDFIMLTPDKELFSNNVGCQDFVLAPLSVTDSHPDDMESSCPLSPSDREHFHMHAALREGGGPPTFKLPRAELNEQGNSFVMLRNGTVESSIPLSPTERKLYWTRHAKGSPKLLTCQGFEKPPAFEL